ncbi:hypothetical protein [Neobacillus vireti]|uniref:Uncharacterized protein n=1 Tax=Neobacillus vireti LMG 21834 TaxID=1131730 RepID=A0AB94IR93_9BACI|nr:hypothetical protein [Neobacillus vireti]ETI69566.1 hypothetical protein BAVI_06599 [Neobacillus vireti LMG 21834]KLT15972.1 hypothetical protein AA980_22565 [Neobacillus vireti]
MKKAVKVLLMLTTITVITVAAVNIFFKNNTTSHIKVLEKGKSNSNYWIVVIDPNSFDKKKFKINVDCKSTWNLLEEDKTYTASYEYLSINWKVDLVEIHKVDPAHS